MCLLGPQAPSGQARLCTASDAHGHWFKDLQHHPAKPAFLQASHRRNLAALKQQQGPSLDKLLLDPGAQGQGEDAGRVGIDDEGQSCSWLS